MTEIPVCLDEHRGMAAQRATEGRRADSRRFQINQAVLQRRQAELERHLLAAPAETWPEAAEKAEYLILLFAETLDAQDQRRRELIAHTLDDLARLSGRGDGLS